MSANKRVVLQLLGFFIASSIAYGIAFAFEPNIAWYFAPVITTANFAAAGLGYGIFLLGCNLTLTQFRGGKHHG